jgi:hypothetical protein
MSGTLSSTSTLGCLISAPSSALRFISSSLFLKLQRTR